MQTFSDLERVSYAFLIYPVGALVMRLSGENLITKNLLESLQNGDQLILATQLGK